MNLVLTFTDWGDFGKEMNWVSVSLFTKAEERFPPTFKKL